MSVKAMRWAYGLFEVIDIPPAERAVLLALCWEHTDAGGCFPSQERVALLSGYRRRRVQDSLAILESQGFIRRTVARKGGKFQQTTYRLFCAPKVKPCADGGARHRAQTVAHGHRAQTGAQYRGIYNKGVSVIEFPSPEARNSGGAK